MSLGNTNIHQQGEIPEITKLPNGRIRVIRRFVKFTREDVDNIQLGTLLGNFGDLDTTGEQIPNQGYTNCRLISVEVEQTTKRSAGTDSKDNVLVQTYETLTGSFVEITDPTISIAENGLKQITKVYRAISGTVSSGVIGETQLTSGEFLASSQIEDNTAFAELTEVYLEAGTLSETLDSVGSQKAKVIETIGIDPVTPDGYSLASKQESDFEGFQTNRFTFLKDNVELSRSLDKVGSQLAIVTEVFNPDEDPVEAEYIVARTEVSDVDGIPTKRFTFLKDNVKLSESEDKVGSQLATTQEWFNPTDDPTITDYILANTQESDIGGIPTKRFTFLKNNVELSRSEDKVGSQLAIVTEVFNPTDDPEEAEYSLARTEISDVDGIPTKRFTFLKDDVQLSQSEDKVGSQNAITEQWFKPEASRDTKTSYSLARKEESDVEGIPTERYTFLEDDVELSRSEDKVGSQLAITTEVFNPTTDPTEEGYSVARTEVSDVDGIPTKRFTFLKDNVELSRSEDKVGSQLAIVTEIFKPESDPEETGYSVARIEVSDVDGIPTKRFTFLKDNAELSRSEDLLGSQLAIVTEVFNPDDEPTEGGYSLARTETSDVDGIPTKRFTFLKDGAELSRSEDLIGSQLAITTEVFKPEADPEESGYSVARIEVSDVDGIPTKRFTFLKDNVELSRIEDLVGSQLAIVTEVFNPEDDPEESGYVLAKTEASDVVGIPTKRFTFLKENVELSRIEDLVGSQLAITTEVFNPTEDPEESGYSVARTEVSDVDGIPTKRFTFLKEDVELSRTEDKVGSQLAITTEIFKPEADPEETGYSVALIEVSDVDGIPTKRFTFLKDDVKLSESEDKVGSQLAKVQEWFNPADEPTIDEYVIANTQISDVDGIPTKRYTFLKENVKLSESEDNVGSQMAKVQEWFNPTEEPEIDEYVIANTQISDVDGIQTKRYTFLKENVELSRSEDKVGSQLAITTEVFKPEADPEEEGYIVARTEVSDVDGIPTKKFTLLKDNVELSRIEDFVGSQLAIVTEVFNPTDDPEESGYSVARTEISDVEGIPTKRFTFLKDDVELSRSEDLVGSQLAITTEVFNPTEDPEEDAYSLARTEVSDVDGIPTKRFTFLKDNVQLFRSEDLVGSQLAIVTEVFNPEEEPEIDEYVLARTEVSDADGIPTKRYTFLKENIKLSESEDKVGSQLARVQEWFNPTEEPEIDEYVIANVQVSDYEGIPTKRYTFLKDDVELSRIEDFVGSQLAITTEVFKPTEDPEEEGYSVARTEVSDIGGIPTKRFTFLKDNAELSRSEDLVGSQLAIVTEVFNPEEDPEEEGYSVARTETSDVDGIPTKRFTSLKDDAELSRSEDKVGSQLAITTEVFNPTEDPEESGYSVARTEVSDVDGIPTKRFTLLKDDVELSRIEDLVGSQLAIVTEVFNPTDDPEEAEYSLARTEVSDVDGIPTKRFTLLKDDAVLSRNEDFVGSQLAIVTEVFNPTDDPDEPDYVLARTEASDVDGIPTKRFTFLKENVELFHSEDFEGGLKEIVEEWFKPIDREEKSEYVLIEKTQSDVGGIPTERYTFWKEKGLIDESYVNEAEGVIRTTQVFFSEVDDALVEGPIVSKDTKNIDGIPTITVTTLQGSKGISIIGSGERLANSYDQLVPFTYPGILDIANQPTGGFTSYSWRLSAPVQSLVTATTYVIFQDTNTISGSDFTYGGASSLWNPTEWAKGQSYGVGYSYRPFAESKGFRGYRADADVQEVTETQDNEFLINGNLLFEDTTGGLNVYGGPEDPNGNTYVLDVKITPAFVDIDGITSYKKVIIVANIPVQQSTEPTPPPPPEPEP